MRRFSRTRTDEPFQMAPMIDMVFLLLVFFMTVSTLDEDARPEIAPLREVGIEYPVVEHEDQLEGQDSDDLLDAVFCLFHR
jgi:hypothetical protein